MEKSIHSRIATLTSTESVLLYKTVFNRQGRDFPLYIIPERQLKQCKFPKNHYQLNCVHSCRLFNQQMGYGFPRYSPMIYLFNDVIVWLKDCGIVEQVLERNSPYRSMESQVLKNLYMLVANLAKCQFIDMNICYLMTIMFIKTSDISAHKHSD